MLLNSFDTFTEYFNSAIFPQQRVKELAANGLNMFFSCCITKNECSEHYNENKIKKKKNKKNVSFGLPSKYTD